MKMKIFEMNINKKLYKKVNKFEVQRDISVSGVEEDDLRIGYFIER